MPSASVRRFPRKIRHFSHTVRYERRTVQRVRDISKELCNPLPLNFPRDRVPAKRPWAVPSPPRLPPTFPQGGPLSLSTKHLAAAAFSRYPMPPSNRLQGDVRPKLVVVSPQSTVADSHTIFHHRLSRHLIPTISLGEALQGLTNCSRSCSKDR